MDSSWARWYPDFESLVQTKDLVIVGEVVNSQLDPQDQIFTFHDVLVFEVIKDSYNEVKSGSTILLRQFGGIWAPKADFPPVPVEFSDCPLMKKGETCLLFLNHRPDGV